MTVVESKIELLNTQLKMNVTKNEPTTPLATDVDDANSLRDAFNENIDMHVINNSFNEIGSEVTSHGNRLSIQNATVNEDESDNNDIDDDNDSSLIDDENNDTMLHALSDCYLLSLANFINKGKEKMKLLDI